MTDLLDSGGGGGDAPTTEPDGKKAKKPLSKGQKIGVVIGVVTILLVIVQIERSKSSSTAAATSSPIDPTTGDPAGSAADQAALAQLGQEQAAGGGSYGGGGSYSDGSSPTGYDTSTVSGTDPSTGLSYSAEIASNASGISTLQDTITTDFSTITSEITGLSTTQPQTPVTPPTLQRSTGPTAAQTATLAKLNQELGKDQAGTSANDKKATATLKKQIAAVTKRS